MTELIQTLLRQASASGSRSTVLQPLAWLLGLLVAGLIGSLAEHAPNWTLIFLAVLLALSVLAYIGAFLFFARKNPEALRSERFTLSKMAIERSEKGDTIAGFRVERGVELSEPKRSSTFPEENS